MTRGAVAALVVVLFAVLFAVLLAVAAAGCKAPWSSAGTSGSSERVEEAAAPLPPMDAREAAQWTQAAAGEPEELMRLVDLVGCEGLRERADERPDRRATALHAMPYCPDFSELPWLAGVAEHGPEADAQLALEAIDALAARPRRSTDPEDAEELHQGCDGLRSLARGTPTSARARLALRALRMLADRGCAPPAAAPKRDL